MRILGICAVLAIVSGGVLPSSGLAEQQAVETGPVTNLPLPRYVSLRSSKINVRRGPGLDYRKDWVFRRTGMPVRVVDEYGDWRRIVDKDDAGGWVYHAMITGRRTVLITGDNVLFRQDPADTSSATARAEHGVVARLRACEAVWCEVEAEGFEGWVRKLDIWGVDAGEEFER
ncbi:MAG: SH3 domain-containing protein [Paracoccaceae bacterium]